MGKLADWSIGHKESKSCDKCGMEKSVKKGHHCCNDKLQIFKNIAAQNASGTAIQMAHAVAVAMPVSVFELSPVEILSITEANPINKCPSTLKWHSCLYTQLGFPDIIFILLF